MSTIIKNEDLRTAIEMLGGQTAVSKRLEIPYRTIQNWYSGTRNPPPYVARMIIEIAITEDKAQNITFDLERELEAREEIKEMHSASAEVKEPEKLAKENETLKCEKEELEMRLEEYKTCYQSALEEIRRLKK